MLTHKISAQLVEKWRFKSLGKKTRGWPPKSALSRTFLNQMLWNFSKRWQNHVVNHVESFRLIVNESWELQLVKVKTPESNFGSCYPLQNQFSVRKSLHKHFSPKMKEMNPSLNFNTIFFCVIHFAQKWTRNKLFANLHWWTTWGLESKILFESFDFDKVYIYNVWKCGYNL